MVTPSQAEELLLPVMVRAHAVRTWPQLEFVDQAAEYLVRKLELDKPNWRDNEVPARHRPVLERCKWIDQQVLGFLSRYPHAMGIELGAGLSTRFQRLSARVEWPKFSWVDVDNHDVIDCADLIFPHTDNYRLVACDVERDAWLELSHWQPGVPLIVVVENLARPQDSDALMKMLGQLINTATNSSAPVHLILDYASPVLQKIRNALGYMLYANSFTGFCSGEELIERLNVQGNVVCETDLAATTNGSFLHRWLAKIYHRLTQKCFWGAVHLNLVGRSPTTRLNAATGLSLLAPDVSDE